MIDSKGITMVGGGKSEMSLLFISDIWTTCDTEKQNIYCIALLLHDLFAENQSAGDCFFNNEMLTA